jgi:hypothetical protein
MKKYGKPLLYILVWLLLSSFLGNSDNATIYKMVESFNQPLNGVADIISEIIIKVRVDYSSYLQLNLYFKE